ncbi:hypothetical protein [Chitinophaga sp. Cy-1792]|uniref:hypothetical protein n=1 Tax=Chitinophaga sp. Cy-1792 TaxID=2608339 RepID=UPI00141E0795|nr:hypothetical protein [Chitinophaga sp. Cy-1792]NIG55359.1 hypothetical protein [Chitinophaga sp. Cy-1792]
MKIRLLLLLICFCSETNVDAQTPAVFKTSDAALQKAYDWALQTALGYQGNPHDPVGPWYEAALPSRNAFCMRDVAHQTIGAAISGMGKANSNMLHAFAANISEGKDWCSYWEINKYGKPAPEDYRNDTAFWYNLNANFDIMFACWKLYKWTGDPSYINDPVFVNFFDNTVDKYIRHWRLQPDSLLVRPPKLHAPSPFNNQDNFHTCRGLPSYVENVRDLSVGVDLIAAIYRGLLTYSSILTIKGDTVRAAIYRQQAGLYQQHIDQYWWNPQATGYYTWYTHAGKFGVGEGEVFLLWFDALTDTTRSNKTIEHLLAGNWNVENMSYLPVVLWQNGYWQEGRNYLLKLTDKHTLRRTYPEVSFGVLEGFIRGLMGISPDAEHNRITTLYRGKPGGDAAVDKLQVLNSTIAVTETDKRSSLGNKGNRAIVWRASFAGAYGKLLINGKQTTASHWQDNRGHVISYADVEVGAGKTCIAAIVN